MFRIFVNATALRSGGALSILHQFVEYGLNSSLYFDIAVHTSIDISVSNNIRLIKMDKTSWISRVIWDSWGVNQWVKSSPKHYDAIISLQNTSMKSDLKQFIYLHQSLPFYEYKISFFSDFKFKCYQLFYKNFIMLNLKKNDEFIVQSEWLKDKLCQECDHKISVFRPKVTPFYISGHVRDKKLMIFIENKIFFYPAAPYSYKNHIFLLDVLEKVKNAAVVIAVTFNKGDYPDFDQYLLKKDLSSKVLFLGYLSRDQIFAHYLNAYALVFPSEVETFGLPLLEAASLGKKILSVNLPYAQDVLKAYEGVSFLSNKDLNQWSKAIDTVAQNEKMSFDRYTSNESSWKEFFEYIEANIHV